MDRRLRWLPALVVALVVLAGSLTPNPPHTPVLGPFGLVGFDKYEHTLAYLALGGTLAFALLATETRALALVVALVAASLFGGGVEVLQGFTGRDPSLLDWAADTFGAVLGVLLATGLDPWLARIRPAGDPHR